MIETRTMILVPAQPRCSKCLQQRKLVVQFLAISGEHGARIPGRRGTRRSVRLCWSCLESLRDELKKAMGRKT